MPREAAEVEVGAEDVLHGEAQVVRLRSEAMWTVSRWCSSGGPVYQGMSSLCVDDVVALQRRHRDELHVGQVELGDEAGVVGLDLLEDLLRVADEVHLVDGDDDVLDAQQRDDEASAAGSATSTPWRASMRMMASWQVDAPVAMLRVYCSWPGVSAMMNLRLSVEK